MPAIGKIVGLGFRTHWLGAALFVAMVGVASPAFSALTASMTTNFPANVSVGDLQPHQPLPIGNVVNFWGAQWWKNNVMSGFTANGVASFKGYADAADAFCGPDAKWITLPAVP